jgi:hypothetical protein
MERELGIEIDHLGDKYAMKVADRREYSQRGGGRRKHNFIEDNPKNSAS